MGKKSKKKHNHTAYSAKSHAVSAAAASHHPERSPKQLSEEPRTASLHPYTVDRDLTDMPKTRLSQPFGMSLKPRHGVHDRFRLAMGHIRNAFGGKNKKTSMINHQLANNKWSKSNMKSSKSLFSLASRFTNTGTSESFGDHSARKPVLWALVVGIIGTAGYFGYAIMTSSNTVTPVVTHVAPVSSEVSHKTALENAKSSRSSKVEGVKHTKRQSHLFGNTASHKSNRHAVKHASVKSSKKHGKHDGKIAKANGKHSKHKKAIAKGKKGKKKSQKMASTR